MFLISGSLKLVLSRVQRDTFKKVVASCSDDSRPTIKIVRPYNGSVYPADFYSLLIQWEDSSLKEGKWKCIIADSGNRILAAFVSDTNELRVLGKKWDRVKKKLIRQKEGYVYVYRYLEHGSGDSYIVGKTSFGVVPDKVEAGIFFRAVPLPFKYARENLHTVRWHLGFVSEGRKAPAVLKDMPVCANCHSFSDKAKLIAMDVDARDDKGAYFISEIKKETVIRKENIISWSNYQPGEATYGLLSQISPDGKYVVSTLKDSEVFVDRSDFSYSQLFFPIRGILVVLNRTTGEMKALPGADDTVFVQSNPVWSPDGRNIYYARARAISSRESGLRFGTVPCDSKKFYAMIDSFFNGLKEFKFDIYRIPFNDGKGGKPEPVRGASENGKSNFFPKISPDGKWLVYTQATNFMLLQPDSRLVIIPASGGEPRYMRCNLSNMNSWHSWSPDGKWMVFSSKEDSPYTRLYLTYIDENGNDSPPVLIENMSFQDRAANIPEFVNVKSYAEFEKIVPEFYLQDVYYFNRMAREKLAEQNYIEAFNLFSHSIEINPEHFEAYLERSKLYLDINKYSEALHDINKAIALKFDCKGGHRIRGIILTGMEQYEEALRELNLAVELDTTDAEAFFHLGMIKINRFNDLEGCSDLQKSASLNYPVPREILTSICAGRESYSAKKNSKNGK